MHSDIQKVYNQNLWGPLFVGAPGQLPTLPSPKSGPESKIDEDISTYSIFPDDYLVFRKDRNQHGGGVFIAARNITVSGCPPFSSDYELQWCSMQMLNSGPFFFGCYYCPPNNRQASVASVEEAIDE